MVVRNAVKVDSVDMTPMIDIVFQLIIFFMMGMALAAVYGVAVKFPFGWPGPSRPVERIEVYVQSDHIAANHQILKDGILKMSFWGLQGII